MADYETFEHEADIGIRGFGNTMEESFANCAKAMFSIMIDLENVNTEGSLEIETDGSDNVSLLINFLNELLTYKDVEEMTFKEFDVKITGNKLVCTARGEKNNEHHEFLTEVKAATFHEAKVEEHLPIGISSFTPFQQLTFHSR